MKRLQIFVVTTIIMTSNAFASDTGRELQKAVHQLNAWLGHNEKADEWRRVLDLNTLETQSAKGARADVAQLSQILGRLSSNQQALEQSEFNQVRLAIQAHIKSLSGSQNQDLEYEIGLARANYRTITLDQLEQRRDQAVKDLKLLKKYYRKNLYSRERALLFYDLQLDELMTFMEELEFEMPPDISVGKLTDQLNLMKKRISEVEGELDNLPEPAEIETVPPQPDDENLPVEATEQAVAEEEPGENKPESKNAQDEDDQEADDVQLNDEEIRKQRGELQEKLERLKSGEAELQQLRTNVLREDRDRQRTRVQVWRQFGAFNRGVVKVGQRKNDYMFAAFQHSFYKVAMLYFYGTDDNLQAEFNEKLDTLDQEFKKLSVSSERDAAAAVGTVIGWLDATEQSRNLIRLIEKKYSLPNLRVSVSRDLVNRLASQPVSDGRRVNEIILGRLIRGEAATRGTVSIDFIEDPNQARLSIHLLGNIVSQTHTRSGRFTGYAGASGLIEARQNLIANVGGLLAEAPSGSAHIDSEFYGVDARSNLVQKIGRKQYLRDKEESERISEGRIKTQFMEKFLTQTSDALSQGRKRLVQALKKAEEIGGYLPELYLRTTYDRFWAIGHRTTFKLAESGRVSNLAATVMPTESSVNAEIAVQIHETLLSNYVDEIFSNRTFTNDELAAEAERLTGDVPEGLATADDEEGWSITFSGTRPIQFEFDNNRLAVTITGRRFSQGDSRLQAGLKIRIPFIVKRVEGKMYLFRDGDAVLDYVDPERLTAKIVAFKSFLETKLNKEDAEQPGVLLPDNLIPVDEVEQLKDVQLARELRLVELRTQGGWLYVGWNHAPVGMYFSAMTDTPAIWREIDLSQPDQIIPPNQAPGPNETETQTKDLGQPQEVTLDPLSSPPVQSSAATPESN